MKPSPFYFTICQVGAEKALKEEMARIAPDLRFAFSRPGFVTFKKSEGEADPQWSPSSYNFDTPRASIKIPRRQGRSEASDQAVFDHTVRERAERERSMRGISTMHQRSVFARSWGVSLGRVGADIDSLLGLVRELDGTQETGTNELSTGQSTKQQSTKQLSTKQQSTRKLRLHVWERDIAIPGDEPLGYQYNEEAKKLEALLRARAPEVFSEGSVAQEGDLVFDVMVIERPQGEKPLELQVGYHIHTSAHSPHPGGRAPLMLPEQSPSRAWYKLEEMVLWSKAPLRAGDIALEVGSAPGGMSYAMLERGLSVIGIDPGQMAENVLSHPRYRHIAEPVNAVRRESLPESIQWMLLDMNVKPDVSLFAVDRLVSRAGPDLMGVLLTVKLNDWKYAREIPHMIKHVEAMGLRDIRVGQLAYHRREIAIVGFTRKGLMRLGRRIAHDGGTS